MGVYSRPEANNQFRLGEFSLATLLFVFSETETFFLVGHAMDFQTFSEKPDQKVDKVVRGWVPKDRCIVWNNRQALEWNWENHQIRKLPGVILSEYDHGDPIGIFNRERTGEVSGAWLKRREEVTQLITNGGRQKQVDDLLSQLGVYSHERYEVNQGRVKLFRMTPHLPDTQSLGRTTNVLTGGMTTGKQTQHGMRRGLQSPISQVKWLLISSRWPLIRSRPNRQSQH